MSETTVEFSTDLEPEENEATLTEQEARKILLSKIARVDQPNASWVTNKIGQAVNFLHPDGTPGYDQQARTRSEEHSLNSSHITISYAVFCLKKKITVCG